ncbi:MAG: hypothetical protein K2N23_06475 [Clostridia bacterium]|nr:hypothetical protein [Clostridia bacterium]
MNKFKKLLSIFAVTATIGAGIAGLAGCGGDKDNGDDTSKEHSHHYSWVDNGDGTHKQHCDVDGCDAVDKNQGKHYWEGDNCKYCGAEKPETPEHKHDYKYTDNKDGTHTGHCAVEGCDEPDLEPEEHIWGEDDKCEICGAEKPEEVKHNYGEWQYNFNGHYRDCKDEGCEEPRQEGEHEWGANGICEVCGAKFATYELIPSNMETQSFSSNFKSGIFTISSGASIRTRSRENKDVLDYKNPTGAPVATGFTASKSVKIEKAGHFLSVNAIAAGRLTIYFDNGSTTKSSPIQVVRPDGTTERIDYPDSGLYALVVDCATAGEYKIARVDGTTDIYYAKFETVVGVTPVEKIEIVDEGKVSYFKGQDFDYSDLQLQIVRKVTGTIEPLDVDAEGVVIDDSEFNKDAAGTYKIKVSYTVDGETFKAEYSVVVFNIEAIELGFNGIYKGGNTTAGNGQYINRTVKQFYFQDEDFDSTGLIVKTVMDNGTRKTIVTEGFTIEGFEKGKAGKQTITVYWTDYPELKQTFDVYVAAITAASVTVDEQIEISVNGNLDDNQVGVRSNGAYQFKTIQQSLDFLNKLTLEQNVKKVINLAEGLYTERLEINIPNLIIKGASKDASKTVIEWDSLVGIADESGFVHITDSTATLNVRDKAVGFVIEDVTVSNWYNSTEHFDQVFGPGYGEHRALAVLIQADKVVMDNCRLLGYQDTIELFTGRQLIQNTYICGRTDFIFGTNNTTYFKDCTIESIVDGGYVTAFKGCNKGAGDWVQYGAIFDGCEFIAPASVVAAANTSLGRTWGAYAAVAYINCDFDGHISTKGYTSGGGTRYTAMNGLPTDETVKFVEYNNSGDGAISTEVAGMKMLTATEAANYSDFSVIFGTENGLVTYTDTWDGAKGVEITSKTYTFDSDSFPNGNVSASAADAQTVIFDGLMTVHGAWNTELGADKNFGWFQPGTSITFDVEGTVAVTFYSGYGTAENVKINYKNGKATLTFSGIKVCVTSIIVDSSETPVHVHEYGAWTVATAPTDEAEGTAERTCVDCEDATPAVDSLTLPVLSEDNYTITAGTTAGNSTYTLKTDETISFEAATLAGMHVHNYGDWVITATATGAGTATKECTGEGTCDVPSIVVDLPALSDSAYVITDNTATLDAEGTGTYTITVDETEVSFTAATPKIELTEVTKATTVYTHSTDKANNNQYVFLDGDCYDNNGNYLCFKTGTITLNVAAGATITISGGYYQAGSWGFYKAYEKGENGELTELTDEVEADANKNSASFTTENGGIIVITKDDSTQASLTTISVEFKNATLQEITGNETFSSSSNRIETTDFIQFSGVQDYQNGGYWLFKTGTGSIKIKVAAGATITLKCGYWGSAINVVTPDTDENGTNLSDSGDRTFTVTTAGEVIITSGDASKDVYLQSIEISFPVEE